MFSFVVVIFVFVGRMVLFAVFVCVVYVFVMVCVWLCVLLCVYCFV